jgi:hypothetical protein
MDRWTTLSAKVEDVFHGAGETEELSIVIYEVPGEFEQPPTIGDGRLSSIAKSRQTDLRHAPRADRNARGSLMKWFRRWLAR